MKTTAILSVLAGALLGSSSAQNAPDNMPVISAQKMNGNGCYNVNDFRVTFPNKETMRVEYYGFYANAALRGKEMAGDRTMCIPFITLQWLERGWRVSIGDSTWSGYAKFTGGNKLASWDTALSWQFKYQYVWNVNAADKLYTNWGGLGIHEPSFLPGEGGDYETEFTATVKSDATETKWSPCFQGVGIGTELEEHEIEFYSQAILEQNIKAPGDAIFGYPASSAKPSLVQEYKLKWEKCDPESIWTWGSKPMQKPADADNLEG